MTRDEVLAELESLGTEQTRKTYARHGVGPEMYGVSYAELYKLQKRIKVDHPLAVQLWETGNHDARILATMIIDPAQVSAKQLDNWVKDLTNYAVTGAFAGVAARSAHGTKKAEKWIKSKDEFTAEAGWDTLARLTQNPDVSDAWFEGYLEIIERDIHKAKNRTKYAMNGALIAIGVRNDSLQAKALEVAARVGKVEVDHGKTSCKTPDAATYIRKVADRVASKGKKRA